MLRFSCSPALGAAAVLLILPPATAQQSDISLSPFVSFLPSGNANPMAGLALSFAGGPLALRAGGHISLTDRTIVATSTGSGSTSSTTSLRPWGADADAIALLDGLLDGLVEGVRLGFRPYVFAGVSTGAIDSGAHRIVRQGWSYGGGASLPIGSALGVFSEIRWRMSEFVLPRKYDPAPAHEFRVGLSFRVGGGSGGGGGALLGDAVRIFTDNGGVYESSSAPTAGATRILSTAEDYIGAPYRRGGASPSSGFDASGFVRFVFSKLGVNLPRASRDQARVGQRVRSDWKVIAPGDLLLFEDDGGINHVAIYVGRNRMIHSSATGGGVRYDDLDSERGRWFLDHLVAVRRVTPDVRGLLLDLARGYPTDVNGSIDGPDHAPKASMRRR